MVTTDMVRTCHQAGCTTDISERGPRARYCLPCLRVRGRYGPHFIRHQKDNDGDCLPNCCGCAYYFVRY